MNILSEIWSSISQNRFRTMMTGFAVAWGIFILVVLLGASNGLQNGLQQNYGSRMLNSMTIWTGWTSMPYKGLPKDRQLYFTEHEANLVRNLPEVELFSVVASTSATVNIGSQFSSVEIKGVEVEYLEIYRKTILQGRLLNQMDELNRNKVCLIDERTQEELISEDIVGKYIKAGDIFFLVVGICKNGDRWEQATVHIPLSTYKSLYSPDIKFNSMVFTLSDEADVIGKPTQERWGYESPYGNMLYQLLSPSMQFDPNDKRALWISSQADNYQDTQNTMSAIRLFVLIVGLCTLVSGAVGVSNIMLVSVRERTKEFGIRKAIGAPPSTILFTVVGESILITGLFGYIGMFLGIGLMDLINSFIPLNNDIFTNPTVDIAVVSMATAVLVIVGVIAGTIPAARAMKIKPIEALNYEK